FFSHLAGYGDRPRLPSFPTRRSSDLVGRHANDLGSQRLVVVGSLGEIARLDGASLRESRGIEVQHHRPLRQRLGQLEGIDLAAQDRKSTRLNSSHVKISYAVFCLKKK